jgi:glutathione S-transferase
MKIWGDPQRGNPTRVAIFCAEKGIAIPFVPVDLIKGEHRTPAFLARNPAGLVPVLELDDGTCISETMAICRYLESLHPEPALMGRTSLEQAVIEMWQRRVELKFGSAVVAVFRHSVPFMQALEPVQIAAWADLNRPRVIAALAMFEPQLRDHPFIAGETFSVADITAIMLFWMLRLSGIAVPEDCPSVARWRENLLARPSVTAIIRTRPLAS